MMEVKEFPESIRNFLDSADAWLVGDFYDEHLSMLDPVNLAKPRYFRLIGVFSTLGKAQEARKKGYFILPIQLDVSPVRNCYIC